MKKYHRSALFLAPLFSAFLLAPLHGRDVAAPTPEVAALRGAVEYLASPELAGRMTGTEGAHKAADYLAAELQKTGALPAGDEGSYFHAFEFSAGVEVDKAKSRFSVTPKDGKAIEFAVEEDFRPLAFTGDEATEGELVFAGYGLRTPSEGAKGYNSYAGLDVEDKVVVVFRYVPEEVSMERRAELNRYAGLRYKALIAREQGAKALIVITGPNSPGAGELVSITTDKGGVGSGIPAITISQKAAEALFARAGKDLKEVQTSLDKENPHVQGGFAIPDTTVSLSAVVNRMHKPDRNVVGQFPPTGRFADKPEYVLVGAHYDHLGHGEADGSMKHKGEEDLVHYGADDNASGTALVVAMARSEAARRKANPEQDSRGVVFAFWSGEEIGIIGSSRYAERPTVPMEQVAAYLNFDMVGRLRENRLSLQGLGSSGEWKKLIEKRNVAAGFNLSLQDDPWMPTDSTAFYPKQVPVLSFFTGSHEDYHRPTDTPDKLNYEGIDRIARFGSALVADLATAPERLPYVKVERSGGRMGGGSRDSMRATVGSIPDYAAEVKGVKLSGVRGGTPADKAGLKGGDVIVEFAGQKITNIYDYTYALDAVKIGVPVKVIVERDGKTETLTVTPEARR